MKPLYLVDLDDTLFRTAGKIPVGEMAHATPASTLADGSISGYRTVKTRSLMDVIMQGDVIPVTARSSTVMARVDVPQAPAICSNGGLVLGPDGAADPAWAAHVAEAVGDGSEILRRHRLVAALLDDGFRHWIVEDGGVPLYVVVKHNRNDEAEVQRIADDLVAEGGNAEGWRIHVNGNNLAMSPRWLTKRAAVRHVVAGVSAAHPDRLIIGMGDSISDLGFMAECDYAMHPVDSQIGRRLAVGHDW